MTYKYKEYEYNLTISEKGVYDLQFDVLSMSENRNIFDSKVLVKDQERTTGSGSKIDEGLNKNQSTGSMY